MRANVMPFPLMSHLPALLVIDKNKKMEPSQQNSICTFNKLHTVSGCMNTRDNFRHQDKFRPVFQFVQKKFNNCFF